MDHKHTPGPWWAERAVDKNGFPETNGEHWISSSRMGCIDIAVTSEDYRAEVQQANARLIAAAPELLEALECMLNACPAIDPHGEDAHKQACAAIAKARGNDMKARTNHEMKLPKKTVKLRFVSGPYTHIGASIYAESPQPVDNKAFHGLGEREPGRGYLIAESIPHAPTRRLLAKSTVLFETLDRLEDAMRDLIEDGRSADIEVLKRWHNDALKALEDAAGGY